MANLLNLVPNALPQDPQHPAMFGYVSTTQPVPQRFTDPLYVVIPDFTNEFYWTIHGWPALYGVGLPTPGAACLVIPDNRGTLRCVWWAGEYSYPAPVGSKLTLP